MAKKVKYGKILAVVFITVLIWVWADLALDEVLPDRPATVAVDESANLKLWVSFDGAPSADIKITLSGPHSTISDISRELKEGKMLEFDFDAVREKMDKSDSYTLALLPFLQKDPKLKRLGLKVESCEPETLPVKVVQLVKKRVTVKCIDEAQNTIKSAIIEPIQLDALVPEDWSGEKLTANVQLTRREIDQARLSAVEKTPFIELSPGHTRELQKTVKIKMPPDEDLLTDYTITTARLRFSLSPNLQGKYKVVVENLDEVIRTITIRATPEAKRAYEKMPYQVILEIDDEDADSPGTLIRRELIYNFPDEYLRRDEIRLNQQPVVARFKLIPLSSTETSPGVGE